ncbi:hypothetical protein O0Q50_19885 [Priestia aryabhattai]|uniref:Uncharacterized protein n=1 Tax=Priestia aryabhattai TaxID=412384 RepID=A0AAX6NC24_PRIAR|nr:hypothetical protein [Priestia aryabhattai]MDU9693438.1 hypothetical protein [Priestia aryabhattai]
MDEIKKNESILMKKIKKVESKIRFLLIVFCSFSALFSLKQYVADNLWEPLHHNNVFITSFMVIFSVAIAYYLKSEVTEALGEDWTSDAETQIEKLQNEFLCLVGISAIFFSTQLGLIIMFFSDFQYQTFLTVKLYPMLFIVNSLIVYILYRLTILKW